MTPNVLAGGKGVVGWKVVQYHQPIDGFGKSVGPLVKGATKVRGDGVDILLIPLDKVGDVVRVPRLVGIGLFDSGLAIFKLDDCK